MNFARISTIIRKEMAAFCCAAQPLVKILLIRSKESLERSAINVGFVTKLLIQCYKSHIINIIKVNCLHKAHNIIELLHVEQKNNGTRIRPDVIHSVVETRKISFKII